MRMLKNQLWILALLVAVAAWEFTSPSVVQVASQQESTSPHPKAEEELGLKIKIREGQVSAPSVVTRPRLIPSPLTPAQTQHLLQRLPQLSNVSEPPLPAFQFPKDQPRPPQPSGSANPAFPVSSKSTASGSELQFKVERFRPQGAVELAPNLSVTFSEPMVALTSLDELSTQSVPVKLTPQPPGHWRWVGTKTLVFEPEGGRFPMATQYTVTIPAGSASVTGKRLQKSLEWTFSTPSPKLVSSSPDSHSEPLTPLLLAEFNQRMNPATVLEKVRVKAGTHTVPIRLATQAEIAANQALTERIKTVEPEFFVVLRPVTELERDTQVTVSLEPGLTSAEGPVAMTKAQSFSFHTFSPLKLIRKWTDKKNQPSSSWWVEFNNPLDESSVDASQIEVIPSLSNQKIWTSGTRINIEGRIKNNQKYQIRLLPGIKDVFGQTLGQTVELKYQTPKGFKLISLTDHTFYTLDPASPPIAKAYVRGYSKAIVKLYRVTPADWPKFIEYANPSQKQNRPLKLSLPGQLVKTNQISLPASADTFAEVLIDLRPALTEGIGHVIVTIEKVPDDGFKPFWATTYQWIQVTRLSMEAISDNTKLVVWTNSLQNGKPIENTTVTLFPDGVESTSDAQGVATLQRPASSSLNSKKPGFLVARQGNDCAILPKSLSIRGDVTNWTRSDRGNSLVWYVYDDRHLYRPGETLHLKGWIRVADEHSTGDLLPLGQPPQTITYTLKDFQETELFTGSTQTNAYGGFDLELQLPETISTGQTWIEFKTIPTFSPVNEPTCKFWHAFQIQEFRRPEFVTKVTSDRKSYVVGESAEVVVEANYLAGGGLPGVEVTWNIESTAGQYSPPNWDQFTFGTWVPWWKSWSSDDNRKELPFHGKTDSLGKHQIQLDFQAVNPPCPMNIFAEAQVSDVNRQTQGRVSGFLVHPSNLYIGLKANRAFVEVNHPFSFETIVTDIDGKPQPDQAVSFEVVWLESVFRNKEWAEVEHPVQTGNLISELTPVLWQFTPAKGGRYRITARVVDAQGRPNETQMTLWVAGGAIQRKKGTEEQTLELIPNQKEYQPGETAEILVQSPFVPAQGILTLERSGIVTTERFAMTESSHVLQIPIKETYIPNLYAAVYLVGESIREDKDGNPLPHLPPMPVSASGTINLLIPPRVRTLSVTATPAQEQVAPGDETQIAVEVRDAGGNPVDKSECAVVVVDEAILSLTGHIFEHPNDAFYREREEETDHHHLRKSVELADEKDLLRIGDQTGISGGYILAANVQSLSLKGRGFNLYTTASTKTLFIGYRKSLHLIQLQPGNSASGPIDQSIRLRTNFDPLAVFSPSVVTDANGKAIVSVKMPDNLTKYRVIAFATDGAKRFGKGESSITARLPLMVRPSAPRFLNFGDQFELPVVVQNQTDQPLSVEVAAQSDLIQFPDGAGQQVVIPANDRVEVRFPATPKAPGKAVIYVAASSKTSSDAAHVVIPISEPVSMEAFATCGEVDSGGIQQTVLIPDDVRTEFGKLEITTSSTQLQTLTDAVLYLTSYPFDCGEQVSSRMLALLALGDVLAQFKTSGLPAPEAIQHQIKADITRLESLQNEDGGLGFWEFDQSWPIVSIHAAHALVRAKQKGYAVKEDSFEKLTDYLDDIDDNIPEEYSLASRQTLLAYALYVLHLNGESDADAARDLVKETGAEKLPIEAIGWLLPVLAKNPATKSEQNTLFRVLTNRVTETAGAASFVESYSDGAAVLLHSSRRTDAVILDALLSVQPDSDLIPKLVRGLLAHRVNGRWSNTQENAFVLLALERYFSTFEHHTPDFLARVWLGDTFAGAHRFAGRTTDQHQLGIPLNQVGTPGETKSITLSKDGTGRMYYRLGLSYAPKETRLSPLEAGFTVSRQYQGADNPADVKRLSATEWQIRVGARVKVTVTMVAPARRAHVALSCPLPAGLEILNPALATTPRLPNDEESPRLNWWQRSWFDHQNLRDNRAEAFTASLSEGVYTYSFFAVATTPGKFLVPPARAEEMYAPETFGRSATDLVVVHD